MKIGLLADTHINVARKNNSFFPHVQNAINYFIKTCQEHNVEKIFILGDLFHTKHSISTDTLIKANAIIHTLRSYCPVYCLVGNHDVIALENNKLNLLDIYKYFDNVYVIDEYFKLELDSTCVCHFLPFYSTDVAKRIKSIQCDNNKKNYLFAHCGVSTFAMIMNVNSNENIVDYASQVSPQEFQKFTHTFLGHFHGYQTKDNITYVSAPFSSSFSDEFSKHGFIILDTDSNTYTFIENIYSPRFITLEFTKENIKYISTQKNCYIRFILNKHISKETLISVKQILLKTHYDVDFKFDVSYNISQSGIQIAELQGLSISQQITHQNIDEIVTEYLRQIHLPSDFTIEALLNVLHE